MKTLDKALSQVFLVNRKSILDEFPPRHSSEPSKSIHSLFMQEVKPPSPQKKPQHPQQPQQQVDVFFGADQSPL